MLKLTKKADYGLIAMRHLAERSAEGSCSAKDVADAHGIPPELLAKILQRLVKKGLLTSHMGQWGIHAGAGFADDLGIRCDQGHRRAAVFDGLREHARRMRTDYPLHGEGPLQRVNQSIEEVLSRLTIYDMTEPERVAEELVSIS